MSDADAPYRALGAKLHDLRKLRGLSLKTVADEVGLSPSFLSMVERGRTDLSLSRFSRLAEFYGVQPSELMLELGGAAAEPLIRSIDDARTIERGPGVEYRLLREEQPQLMWVRLEPESAFTDLRAHRGDDYWVSLAGEATLLYGGRRYRFPEGHTASFSGTLPHGVANPSPDPAVLIATSNLPYW